MDDKSLQHSLLAKFADLKKQMGRVPNRLEFLKSTDATAWSLERAFQNYGNLLKAAGDHLNPMEALPNVPSKPKIILFDLETLPNLPEALKVWPQLSDYPGKTLRATITSIICAGWKEYGSKKINCINAWDFDNWKQNVNDDSELCKKIYDALKDADLVVTHNGKRFDWKYLQTRLGVNKLPFLHKIDHEDTKSLCSKHLFLFNNRLNTAGEFLAGDKKMDTGGWDLWVDVWYKKKTAMQKMARYCKQDVLLLEKVFKRLVPLTNSIPNHNLFGKRNQYCCPYCGSDALLRNGWRCTKTTRYLRLRCNSCGGTSRVNKKLSEPRSI